MSNTNTGGPAFPCGDQYAAQRLNNTGQGLSIRDYFAAKAMQAHAAAQWASYYTATANGNEFSPFHVFNESDLADMAYDVADEMLKARDAK